MFPILGRSLSLDPSPRTHRDDDSNSTVAKDSCRRTVMFAVTGFALDQQGEKTKRKDFCATNSHTHGKDREEMEAPNKLARKNLDLVPCGGRKSIYKTWVHCRSYYQILLSRSKSPDFCWDEVSVGRRVSL